MSIWFFSQSIRFSLKKKNAVKNFILSVIRKEKKKSGDSPNGRIRPLADINFIFCSDEFLLVLNKKFLKHDTLTDIITFQSPSDKLSAEIYISIPRVKENAKKFEVSFANELHRLMIHGILHLCGYMDKKADEKKEMRKKEDYYLKFLK